MHTGKKYLFFIAFFLIAVVVLLFANFSYEKDEQELCKGSPPFSAAWIASFPQVMVKYYYLENDENVFVRIDYMDEKGVELLYKYLELYQKDKNVSNQFLFNNEFCNHDTVTNAELYFNSFEISRCIKIQSPLMKKSTEVFDRNAFSFPTKCNDKNTITQNELFNQILSDHIKKRG
ncbi:MAG: hypothetical protein NTY48_05715 [Candidatus Diapherotrites archaeon]|nr:hypothetical protein [Candidatus Diapherotrites archaeon]